jgi:hypothetical protein
MPGPYEARSADLTTFTAFRRRSLVLYFDLYRGLAEHGIVLARVPMFFRLPSAGRPLRPTSKLARVFDLLAPRTRRLDRLPLETLRGKLWRVEVGDVRTSADHTAAGEPRPLHEQQRYSVVRAVLERLA